MSKRSPSLSNSAHADLFIAPHVRQARDEDGLVLLDLNSGRYRTFNPLGARVWSMIEEGCPVTDIIDRVRELFGAPAEVVERDVQVLVNQLLQERLIQTSSETTEVAEFALFRREDGWQEPVEETRPGADARRPIRDSVLYLEAWSTLIFMDLLMQVFHFPRLYSALRKRRTATRQKDPGAARRICRAVDRAASSYFKRAWCLQRSAACAYLLRRNGYPAQMVLGVRTLPFEAHAWVEIFGRVVNDRPEFIQRFLILDRV